MRFERPLVTGTLLRRYKRFLADVQLDDGRVVTAHTANTGSMMGCCAPGARIWLSESDNPKRKYPYTWEIIEVAPGTLVGINTARANGLVREAIQQGVIGELGGYERMRGEVRYGAENSRVDWLLSGHPTEPDCYVEVKNVTLAVGRVAMFPDAVSDRGRRHLRELMAMRRQGRRAALVFCVQREDVSMVAPADAIDPRYGDTLREALAVGVEIYALGARLSSMEIQLAENLPVLERMQN